MKSNRHGVNFTKIWHDGNTKLYKREVFFQEIDEVNNACNMPCMKAYGAPITGDASKVLTFFYLSN